MTLPEVPLSSRTARQVLPSTLNFVKITRPMLTRQVLPSTVSKHNVLHSQEKDWTVNVDRIDERLAQRIIQEAFIRLEVQVFSARYPGVGVCCLFEPKHKNTPSSASTVLTKETLFFRLSYGLML